MRPLGRRERQPRSLLCRASPAEYRQERRGFPSRPFHNFLVGRHPWFGPPRWRPQRRAVQAQIEYSSDRSAIFACDFPRVVFPTSALDDAARMPLRSWDETFRKWLKTMTIKEISVKSGAGLRSEESSALDDCQRADSVS